MFATATLHAVRVTHSDRSGGGTATRFPQGAERTERAWSTLDNQLHQDVGAPFRHPLAAAARLLPPLGQKIRRLQPVATTEERARHLLRFVVDGFGFDAGVILAAEAHERSTSMVEHSEAISAADAVEVAAAHLHLALTPAPVGSSEDGSVAVEATVPSGSGGTVALTLIPVSSERYPLRSGRHVIALLRVPNSESVTIEIDESMARVFAEVVASLLTGRIRDLQDIEETALDSLRHAYNTLPPVLHAYRLELFRRRLQDVSFGYQPIFDIRERPKLHSWEALARFRAEPSSPTWLFETATVWGREFQVAADLHALEIATAKMSTIGPTAPAHLSVNVAPNTLSEAAYLDRCREVFAAQPWLTLTLEISEKSEFIDLRHSRDLTPNSQDSSRNLAEALDPYRSLGCLVAMDDFGAQFSSIVRALALRPDSLKVDRSVVTSPTPHPTLRFAHEFAVADGAQVVAEGVETRRHLVRVCAAGIGMVQGFLFGRATPEPQPPSGPQLAKIARHLEVARAKARRGA
jgi:EAL domain-containing protein (putative c-di-GMP-specific phosphodiesterase class I)